MAGTNDAGGVAGIAWPVFSASIANERTSSASARGASVHAYSMQAVFFRPERFKTKADCLTAAYRQLLPLEVCR